MQTFARAKGKVCTLIVKAKPKTQKKILPPAESQPFLHLDSRTHTPALHLVPDLVDLVLNGLELFGQWGEVIGVSGGVPDDALRAFKALPPPAAGLCT